MCLSRWCIGGVSVSYVLIFMSATSENNKRIAKNTLFLYMRMLLIMGVTLYTSRIVLQVLGVEDFGIYNVVGGIVALLGFISSSMSISIQRFLSYEMGRKNYEKVSRAFSMALQIHGIIAVVVMMLLETAGIYFLRCKMVIPIDRMDSALSVFHCSVLACGFSIVQVPFIALIIAYERMGLYAYIGIVDTMLKLAIAFLLGWIAYDSLALYGGLMLVATIVITLAYVMVCHLSFKEIRYQCIWDTRLFGSLTRFASWSALGEMAWGFTLQGVNIVLNLFFGTVVNAAYGISSQVSAAVYRFLGSFQTAVNPQLIKEYAQGNVMFEVKEDGSVTKVEMKDEYSKVEISKTDLTTGKELEGAKLQIIRKDGTVLEEWITDGKPHSVEKLPVNEELTLREITAPDGYEIAEDVTFTLKDTMEVQKVEMKDARTPEKTTEKTNAPKTGDNQKVWSFVLLALASAGTATGVTVYRRKKSKMTDNKEETEEK